MVREGIPSPTLPSYLKLAMFKKEIKYEPVQREGEKGLKEKAKEIPGKALDWVRNLKKQMGSAVEGIREKSQQMVERFPGQKKEVGETQEKMEGVVAADDAKKSRVMGGKEKAEKSDFSKEVTARVKAKRGEGAEPDVQEEQEEDKPKVKKTKRERLRDVGRGLRKGMEIGAEIAGQAPGFIAEKAKQAPGFIAEKGKEAWRSGKEILRDKEARKQIALSLADTAGSVFGFKFFYDLPKYIQQKVKVKKEKTELDQAMLDIFTSGEEVKEIYEKSRRGEEVTDKEMGKLQTTAEEENAKRDDLFREKSEEGKKAILENIESLSPDEKEEFKQRLEAIISTHDKSKGDILNQERDEVGDTLKTFLKTKISGLSLAKQGLNSAMTFSGALALRGAVYAGTSAAEWALKTEREQKKQEMRGDEVEGWKSSMLNEAKQTGTAMIGRGRTGEESKGKKAVEFFRAWGSVARVAGIGGMAFRQDAANESINNLLDAVSGKLNLGDARDNFIQNATNRFESVYRPAEAVKKFITGDAEAAEPDPAIAAAGGAGTVEASPGVSGASLAGTPEASASTGTPDLTGGGGPSAAETETSPTEFTDIIKNEDGKQDSIWRSTREAFIKMPQDVREKLGYTGAEDDAAAIKNWAENQTGNVIAELNQSKAEDGNLKDLVHEKDKVVVTLDGNNTPHLKIEETSEIERRNLSDTNVAELLKDKNFTQNAVSHIDKNTGDQYLEIKKGNQTYKIYDWDRDKKPNIILPDGTAKEMEIAEFDKFLQDQGLVEPLPEPETFNEEDLNKQLKEQFEEGLEQAKGIDVTDEDMVQNAKDYYTPDKMVEFMTSDAGKDVKHFEDMTSTEAMIESPGVFSENNDAVEAYQALQEQAMQTWTKEHNVDSEIFKDLDFKERQSIVRALDRIKNLDVEDHGNALERLNEKYQGEEDQPLIPLKDKKVQEIFNIKPEAEPAELPAEEPTEVKPPAAPPETAVASETPVPATEAEPTVPEESEPPTIAETRTSAALEKALNNVDQGTAEYLRENYNQDNVAGFINADPEDLATQIAQEQELPAMAEETGTEPHPSDVAKAKQTIEELQNNLVAEYTGANKTVLNSIGDDQKAEAVAGLRRVVEAAESGDRGELLSEIQGVYNEQPNLFPPEQGESPGFVAERIAEDMLEPTQAPPPETMAGSPIESPPASGEIKNMVDGLNLKDKHASALKEFLEKSYVDHTHGIKGEPGAVITQTLEETDWNETTKARVHDRLLEYLDKDTASKTKEGIVNKFTELLKSGDKDQKRMRNTLGKEVINALKSIFIKKESSSDDVDIGYGG